MLCAGLSDKDIRSVVLIGAALFCTFMPLEITHLLAALVGAAAYLLIQTQLNVEKQRTRPVGKVAKIDIVKPPSDKFPERSRPTQSPPWRRNAPSNRPQSLGAAFTQSAIRSEPKPVLKKPSVMPVSAPTFQGATWEQQIVEILTQITPTDETDAVVNNIAQEVQKQVRRIFPKADVAGFTAGSIQAKAAFAVAMPEVEIVIHVNPDDMAQRVEDKWAQSGYTPPSSPVSDAEWDHKLRKSGIRLCIEPMVNSASFKFRRSAFRGKDPKVIFIYPTIVNGSESTVPMSVMMNAATPFHNAALLTECAHWDSRAKQLVLLVRRWAKDRGLCQAAKAYMPPYAWTLLAIFFLQATNRDDGAILPPIEDFEVWKRLMCNDSSSKSPRKDTNAKSKQSVAELFKDFFSFYSTGFDWSKDAVVVRASKSDEPTSIPTHSQGSKCEVPIRVQAREALRKRDSMTAPIVEDPFELGSNLAGCMTEDTLKHMHQEFKRATKLSADQGSLTQLLEPWAPEEEQE